MKPSQPENAWGGSGLPPWSRERILYNAPAETVVAVMYRFGNGVSFAEEAPVRRLYHRRLRDKTYQPVDARHKLESHEEPHCCQAMPFLIFNELRFEERRPTPEYLKAVLKGKDLPSRGWGMDWIGVRRVNLETGEDQRVLDELSLNAPPPYESGQGWVNSILSVSADGSTATCKVGLMTGGDIGLVDYSLYEVSLTEGLKRKLADLPDAFL
jgi:hypothetical protein